MKKTLGILLFVLILPFSFTACESDVVTNPTVYIDLTSETPSLQDTSSAQEVTSSEQEDTSSAQKFTSSAQEVTSSDSSKLTSRSEASSNVTSSNKKEDGNNVDMTDPLVIVASWKTVAQTVNGEKKAEFDHKYLTISQDFKFYPSNNSTMVMVDGGNYYFENNTLTVTMDGKDTVWTVEMKTYDDLKLTKVEDGVTTVMEYEKIR